MIPRYVNTDIERIFSDPSKVGRWDMVELAVIEARAELGLIPLETYKTIERALRTNPCDIDAWLAIEEKTRHDFGAYVRERAGNLPAELQPEFHRDMTSYDTEDPAFALALREAGAHASHDLNVFIAVLQELAQEYRFTLKLGRTHGQWAKLQTFGGMVLTWLAPLLLHKEKLEENLLDCRLSRIAGAIGNYGGGLTPEIERKALEILGLIPFPGSTQILQRSIYAPLAQTLRLLAEEIGKIAIDFRLGARSGTPLWHEPFGKGQMGSSAMPHKKNTISTEQMGGMVELACGYEQSIVSSVLTWEARAIEQSCVERVAWPDLFHVLLRMLSVMRRVLSGMVAYPDHMLEEILASRGTYATDEAKNFLTHECGKRGVEAEVAYRIIQCAAFMIFEPTGAWSDIRSFRPKNLLDIDRIAVTVTERPPLGPEIKDVIKNAELRVVGALSATERDIAAWNKLLREIFADSKVVMEWGNLFLPSNLLKEEAHIFKEVLGK